MPQADSLIAQVATPPAPAGAPVIEPAIDTVPAVDTLPVDALRDTIAAVFSQPAYERGLRETVLDRILDWIAEMWRRMTSGIGESSFAQRAALVLFVLGVIAVVARALYLAHASRVARAEAAQGGRARGGTYAGDAWAQAQALAAAGQFTDAAHALYAAILDAIARRERVRLHPSKTVGDYGRELRRRSSTLFPTYRDFARLYEVVVYGLGSCDETRYQRLRALATEIVRG